MLALGANLLGLAAGLGVRLWRQLVLSSSAKACRTFADCALLRPDPSPERRAPSTTK
jgi:hypothetical protein